MHLSHCCHPHLWNSNGRRGLRQSCCRCRLQSLSPRRSWEGGGAGPARPLHPQTSRSARTTTWHTRLLLHMTTSEKCHRRTTPTRHKHMSKECDTMHSKLKRAAGITYNDPWVVPIEGADAFPLKATDLGETPLTPKIFGNKTDGQNICNQYVS
jgi:hypothetical protein